MTANPQHRSAGHKAHIFACLVGYNGPIHCTLCIDGSMHYERRIPRKDGVVDEEVMMEAVAQIRRRVPDSIVYWRIDNGLVYAGREHDALEALRLTNDEVIAIVGSFPVPRRLPSVEMLAA